MKRRPGRFDSFSDHLVTKSLTSVFVDLKEGLETTIEAQEAHVYFKMSLKPERDEL